MNLRPPAPWRYFSFFAVAAFCFDASSASFCMKYDCTKTRGIIQSSEATSHKLKGDPQHRVDGGASFQIVGTIEGSGRKGLSLSMNNSHEPLFACGLSLCLVAS